MVRTQVQLTEEQIEALKGIAARMNVSLAELIRRGVQQVIGAKLEPTDTERRRRARAWFGRFHSGLGDLSSRHDDYLAERIRKESSR